MDIFLKKVIFHGVCFLLAPSIVLAQHRETITTEDDFLKDYAYLSKIEPHSVDLSVFEKDLHVRNHQLFNTYTLINDELEWKKFWQSLNHTKESILMPSVETSEWNHNYLLAIVGPEVKRSGFGTHLPKMEGFFLAWPEVDMNIVQSFIYPSNLPTVLKICFDVKNKPWDGKSAYDPNVGYKYAPLMVVKVPRKFHGPIAVLQNTQVTTP